MAVVGNTVTINPPNDFPAGASVNVQIPAGAFTDLMGNAFSGINNTIGWNFTIASPQDNTSPGDRINGLSRPDQLNEAMTQASIKVRQMPAGSTAQFVYRGISGTDWNLTPAQIDGVASLISIAIPKGWFDAVGLEYYFEVASPAGEKNSDKGYTYINYVGAGLSIPGSGIWQSKKSIRSFLFRWSCGTIP